MAPAATLAVDENGASPGAEQLTLNVGDSHAGGDVLITFEKVYAGTTTDGTDVYIYVPGRRALVHRPQPGGPPSGRRSELGSQSG